MNQPLLDNSQNDERQFRQINQLFRKIFNPETYSVRNGIEQLKNFGGITSIMSLLQISHREGLSHHANHCKRIQIFGENTSPKGQNIIKKSIAAQRDFTINLLFYIITLRFCIKLLFIRDGIQVDSVFDQISSFVLLIVMILLKAMMDQTQKKYRDSQWVKVKRDGEILQIKQKCIMVGDIIFINPDDTIRVDGMILWASDLSVSQSHTILKQDLKRKYSILNLKDNQYNEQFDPFILAGTTIVYGRAEIIVCRVGQECTFRLNNDKFQKFSAQTTPLIYNLKKVLTYVEKSSNVVAFVASTYFAIYYFHQALVTDTLSWFTFLFILKTYSSFIGFVCLLQKLKIMRSLQFYLQSFRSDKYFRIKNKCVLQNLNEVDLFVIQKQALRILQTERGYHLPKQQFLSYLNRHFKLKIVTAQKKDKILDEFQLYDGDGKQLISDEKFFQDISTQTTQVRLKKLKNSFFITQCNRKKLQSDLIPILEGLQYKIAYIYRFKPNEDNNKTSSNIISICYSQDYSESSTLHRQGNLQEWISVKNTSSAQDHIRQIMNRSIIFCQLYNVYMVQFVNNILVFFFLSWVSIHRGYPIDFYWSLIIIIIARYIFFKIYRSIVLGQVSPHYQIISNRKILKLNIFVFFYYLYVVVNLQEKINVVLFFVSNVMLRTQILLIKIQRVSSLKNLLRYNIIIFTFLSGYIVFRVINRHSVEEQLMLIQYIFGLSLLLLAFGFFG